MVSLNIQSSILERRRNDLQALHNASPPIVYVIDGDVLVRESLGALICEAGWEPLMFASAGEFVSCPHTSCPSCLVLDGGLPSADSLELQLRMAVDRPDMPIVFVSGHGDTATVVRAMKAGAVEFLSKPCRKETLLPAIQSALERSVATRGAASEIKMLRERLRSLSNREREVMELVVSGYMNKQVGYRLGISEITVKAHRGRVTQKMNAGSLAELVNIAGKLGIPQGGVFRSTSMPAANLQNANGSSRDQAVGDRDQGAGASC